MSKQGISKTEFETLTQKAVSRRVMIQGIATGAIIPLAASCTTNPYTGEQEFAFMPESALASMSATAWTEMKEKTPQTGDRQLRSRVERVWSRVEKVTPKHGESWDIAVFDSDAVNAFVMPGNRVGVYRGITELVETDDQLASVMGHEVSHTILRHSNKRASQTMLAQGALAGAKIAVQSSENLKQYGSTLGLLGGAAVQFGVILPFSRKHESEADRYGVDYMHEAGYDVRQSVRVWELMAAKNPDRQPEFLSTHPDPLNRANALRNYINAKGYALM